MHIAFYPASDRPDLTEAAIEYQAIWDVEGESIVEAIEAVSRLSFLESRVNALVFEGVSHSNPLCVRASYSRDVKQATLVHELCHRLLASNNVGVHGQLEGGRFIDEVQLHKEVDLILYDVWTGLNGEDFADRQVQVESERRPVYRHAFDWVLLHSKEDRTRLFQKLIQQKPPDMGWPARRA